MITKEYGKYRLKCDNCEEELEEDFETFQDAVDAKAENGYKSVKKNNEFKDICAECQ